MQSPLGGAIAAPPLKNDELVPNLNNYVRAKLSKSEVLTFADCARALAEALNSTDGSSRELIAKVLIRMSLFGSLPPSILPMLVSVRVKLDLPKTADRKLLRIVNYLIQLAAGEGSAGTVVPFSTLVGQSLPSRATDVFDYNALDPLWADVKSETVTHYQRAAAFRALAALARSSLSSDPDDLTLVSHLMAAVATTLDRCEASKRRKLPFGIGQGSKKVREMDRRQTLERVAAQRAALSASRAGLPGFVLSSKIAPRAAGGVNSPDAACARHALGVAALAARDMPAMYVEQMGQFVLNTLEIHRKTGSLGGAEQAAAIAAAAADGMPAPLRPTKELFQEKSLNLVDDWARLYLARGCGAVVHAGVGNSAPFWEMLVLLACCDRSIIVALEAIRALAGAPYPTSAAVASSPGGSTGTSTAAGGRRVLLPDEHVEADARLRYSMAWNLLMAHADDDAPASSVAAAAGAAAGPTGGFNRQFTISRTQRAVQESAALRRLASLGSDSASGSRAAAGATGASSTTSPRRSLFSAIVSRLLTCLGLMSHAAICSATRVVAILAEARAHALAATRTAADRGVVLGDEEVQHLMQQLEQRMVAIASDAGFSAHQREKALEALLWFSRLPPGRDASPLLTSKQVAHWISSGGGTVSPAVRAIFADPWPEDVVASFMLALSRRLLSAPAAANFLLSCAAAAASAAPSRVRQEQLHAMWDVCLRANAPAVKLAGLQAALSLMCAPTPAIAAPPSAAAPEVKALASKEEAAMVSLSRSAAWWVGENANFGTGEYAWQQRNLTDELVKQLESADTASQQQLAAAAVAINPVLAMLIARLQRVMVTGLWEVRIAAAQALAKIAVRSGEPFRIQCYSILAIAAAGSIAHRSRSSSRGGPAAAAAAAAAGSGNNGAAAAAAASAAMQGAAADPLGVAAVAGPALEVLDHIYAGELVVEQLLVRYGLRRSKWPKKLLKTMEKRNAALVAAISERVCYVPKEHFWPLGNAAKEVITGKEEDEEEVKQRKKKEKEEKEAAKKAAAEVNGETQPLATAATAEQPRRRYDSSDEESPRAAEREANMLDKLQGYDYDPSAPHEDLEYPDDSVSQIDHTDDEHYRDAGAASDDDSDIVLLRGMALYDFTPEEEDEVGISKGETVDVEYEVGGWLQVIRADGGRGLVPKSYVLIKEEEEDSDALSLAGRSSTAGQQTQAQGAADYNSFLERSSMRLRPRISTADSETSSTAPYGSLRQRQQSARRRQSVDEGEGEEPVEALMMSRMVAQVAQQGGEVDRTLEQVDDLERVTRSGGTFNQPQYLHLKEALNAVINSLDQLKLSGDARNMRRQMVDRAIIGLDKLESMHRYVMAGGSTAGAAGGGSPMSTPRQPTAAQSLGAELPPISDAEGATAEEDYQYVPTKVRAVFAFDAEAEGELSMAVGDSLWVEAEVDGWYQVVRDGDGARGLVPTSYVDVEQF